MIIRYAWAFFGAGKLVGLTYLDLVAAGRYGVWVGLRRFEEMKGVQEVTFITWKIRGAVLDQIRSMNPLTRLDADNLRALDKDLIHRRLTDPYARIESCDGQYPHILRLVDEDFEIDELDDEERSQGIFYEAGILDDGPSPYEQTVSQEISTFLRGLVQRLSPQDQRIVMEYFWEHRTLKEIGALSKITESGACRRLTRAVQAIKRELSGHGREIADPREEM